MRAGGWMDFLYFCRIAMFAENYSANRQFIK